MNHKRKKGRRKTSLNRYNVVCGWHKGGHKKSVKFYYLTKSFCKFTLKRLVNQTED